MNGNKAIYEKPVLIRHQVGLQNKYGQAPTLKTMTAIDGAPVEELVARFGSPLYVVSEGGLRRRLRELNRVFQARYPRVRLGWSYKTNYLSALCAVMHQEGSWAEVVSGTEFRLARQAGVPAEKILYNGPHKDSSSLREAVLGGSRIHIDNAEEIPRLEALAEELLPGDTRLAVAIRVNMQLGSQHWDRFGFNLESGRAHEAARRISSSKSLELAGLHCHIGTYVDNTDLYRQAASRLVDFTVWLRQHTATRIRWWDLGGGFASPNTLHWAYQKAEITCPGLAQYAEAICPVLSALPLETGEELPELFLETGRALVDEQIHLIANILSERRLGDGTRALVLNAGVNLLSSTTWYLYDVFPGVTPDSQICEATTLLGNLCMQIDVLRQGAMLPAMPLGAPLVFARIGAYNQSQSTQFIHARPAVVMIDVAGQAHLVQRAESEEEFRSRDLLPEHLQHIKL